MSDNPLEGYSLTPEPDANVEVQNSEGAVEALQKTLAESQAKLRESENKLQDAQGELLGEDYLQFLEAKKAISERAPAAPEPVDFSMMTNEEMASFILEKAEASVQKAVSGLTDQLKSRDKELSKAFTKADFQLTLLKHPEFREGIEKDGAIREEFARIAQDNPAWSVERVWNQIKLVSSAKAREQEEADKLKADKELAAMTEGPGVPASTVNAKDLTPEQAVRIAYTKAFGEQPPE